MATPPVPSSDWMFNDGSGSSAVDDKGVANFSLSGSYTWNSDNLNIDCDTAGNIFQLANGGYYDVGSFTVAVWLNFNAVGTTKQIITLGDGAGSGVSNYAFKLDYSGASGPRAYSCNGSSATATTGQGSLVNGTKYLVIAKYTRTGGSADNVLSCRVTSNGTSWSSDTITNAALMQQVSSFELRGGLTDGNGVNAKYYRILLWNNKVTSTTEDDDIWSWGSEGGSITSGTNQALDGTTSGSGTASGGLTVTDALTGSCSGSGLSSAQLSMTRNIIGSAAGSGTLSGQSVVTAALAGSVSGIGSISAALTETAVLAGSASGAGSIVGTLANQAATDLAGTLAGSGLLGGLLSFTGVFDDDTLQYLITHHHQAAISNRHRAVITSRG